MSLSKAVRFVSIFFLAVAVILFAASMNAALAGTPEDNIKANDGVILSDETIKLSKDGRCLILEDGTRLKVKLNDLDKVKSEKGNVEASYTFSGYLKPNTYFVFPGYYYEAGQTTTFSATWDPTPSQVLVGVVDRDGTWQKYDSYYYGCDSSFTASQSGAYYWIMWNSPTNTITYSGSGTTP